MRKGSVTKAKSVVPVIGESGFVRYFVSRDAVVCVGSPLTRVKLCRVAFGNDGSVYVSFPYMTHKRGLLSPLSVASNRPANEPITFDLASEGVSVGVDVKFSHHASGVVHFSRTGLDARLPERNSFPLDSAGGRVFELRAYRLGSFRRIEKQKGKDLYLTTNFDTHSPLAVCVEGLWLRKSDIETDRVEGIPGAIHVGPRARFVRKDDGSERTFFLLAQPDSPLRGHVLALNVSQVPLARGTDAPAMVFLGGVSVTDSGATGCLAFLYPYDGPQSPREPDRA